MMFTCFAATSCDIPFEQAPVTEDHIRLICGEVVQDWRDLGTILGLDSASMDTIDANHSDCREVARKMLLKWKQKKGKEATVGILLIALEEIERRDVVEKLLGMQSPFVKEISQYRVYLDLFTFITKKLNTYVGKDLRSKVFWRGHSSRGLVKEVSF